MAMCACEHRDVTRREMLKRTLRAGTYAAPMILAASVASPVAAVSPTPQFISFSQVAATAFSGASKSVDAYYTPLDANQQSVGVTTFLGTFVSDAIGVGGGVFPVTLDASVVKTLLISYFLHPNVPPSTPFNSSYSNFVSAAAPVNGRKSSAQIIAEAIIEPTIQACQIGPLGLFTVAMSAAIFNGPPDTAYDFYVEPSTAAAPLKVATASTNAAGNVSVFARSGQGSAFPDPGPAPRPIPLAVIVMAVPAGGSPAKSEFNEIARPLTVSCP